MPSTDAAARQVIRKLTRVREVVSAALGDLAPPDGHSSPLASWLAAYKALDRIDREAGALIEEAWEELRVAAPEAPAQIVNSGSNPAGG